MKKLGSLLLVMLLSFSAVACGNGSEEVKEVAEEAAIEVTVEENTSQEESSNADTMQEAEKEEASKNVSAKEDETESAAQGSSETVENAASEKSDSETSKSAEEASSKNETAKEDEQPAEIEKKEPAIQGYGRMIFVGDSRTVDMFSGDIEEIRGEVHDGIAVYCKDSCKFDYMTGAVEEYGLDNFDTLVSWMGCNEYGDFTNYGPYYDQLIAAGKKVVVCTVGPTQEEYLSNDFDKQYYLNSFQIEYNNSLVSWANSKGVKIIDLYSYISNSASVTLDPQDGIHFNPKPTTELWNVITSNLR